MCCFPLEEQSSPIHWLFKLFAQSWWFNSVVIHHWNAEVSFWHRMFLNYLKESHYWHLSCIFTVIIISCNFQCTTFNSNPFPDRSIVIIDVFVFVRLRIKTVIFSPLSFLHKANMGSWKIEKKQLLAQEWTFYILWNCIHLAVNSNFIAWMQQYPSIYMRRTSFIFSLYASFLLMNSFITIGTSVSSEIVVKLLHLVFYAAFLPHMHWKI